MRIEWFKAKGFRSLRDVEIDGLGPFNVFYGKNGAGKSNLLAAMRLLFDLLAARAHPDFSFNVPSLDRLLDWPVNIDPRHRSQLGHPSEMVLSARLSWAENEPAPGSKPPGLRVFTAEVAYDWDRRVAHIPQLEANEIDLLAVLSRRRSFGPASPDDDAGEQIRLDRARLDQLGFPRDSQESYLRGVQTFVRDVARSAFMLVDADRAPRPEQSGKDQEDIAELRVKPKPRFVKRKQSSKGQEDIAELLSTGHLQEALMRASRHPDAGIRRRYKQLGMLLEGSPFHRPPFEMTEDPQSGRIELVETLTDPSREPRDIPLDLVGLGLAQVYHILARALLGNTRAAAIEEPEAHLHAPSTGMQLRQVLVRLVNEGYLDQLFVATHSNLFDLDPDGYFDVSFDPERGTQVTRKALDNIDKDHLYEPGPAKHILQRLLRRMDENTVLFRKPDGAPVTIREMLDMLQHDDPLAKEFLNDVHGAAIYSVGLRDQSSDPAGGEPVK